MLTYKEQVKAKAKRYIETGKARESQDFQVLSGAQGPDYSLVSESRLVGLACSLISRAEVMERSGFRDEEVVARAAAHGIIGELKRRGLEETVAREMAGRMIDLGTDVQTRTGDIHGLWE